jgi:hypothetical protein
MTLGFSWVDEALILGGMGGKITGGRLDLS